MSAENAVPARRALIVAAARRWIGVAICVGGALASGAWLAGSLRPVDPPVADVLLAGLAAPLPAARTDGA